MTATMVPAATLKRSTIGSWFTTRLPTRIKAALTTWGLLLVCSTTRVLIQLKDPGGGTIASQPVVSSRST
jgi:hypothetical protein